MVGSCHPFDKIKTPSKKQTNKKSTGVGPSMHEVTRLKPTKASCNPVASKWLESVGNTHCPQRPTSRTYLIFGACDAYSVFFGGPDSREGPKMNSLKGQPRKNPQPGILCLKREFKARHGGAQISPRIETTKRRESYNKPIRKPMHTHIYIYTMIDLIIYITQRAKTKGAAKILCKHSHVLRPDTGSLCSDQS